MSTFIQLHLLTSYPPANLNRDDLGRPKTAVMGGVQRLRISSQSLKRAWRTSDLFQDKLSDHLGIRTKDMGYKIREALVSGRSLDTVLKGQKTDGDKEKLPAGKAKEIALAIAGVFGKLKSATKEHPDSDLEIEQLAHASQEEIKAISDLLESIRKTGRVPDDNELNLLRKKIKAVDISLFGRMLASSPDFNVEAAAQVAHAITVHKVAVEDDYFTAVDDLNKGEADMGAGHIGETEFAAGLFYLYICINRDLLLNNIQNDEALAGKTIQALTEAAATIAPIGKQNSFGSRAYASYILAEKGRKQPRSLSVAFLKPVTGTDIVSDAVSSLESTLNNIDKVYGSTSEGKYQVNTAKGEGRFKDLLEFVALPLSQNNDKED